MKIQILCSTNKVWSVKNIFMNSFLSSLLQVFFRLFYLSETLRKLGKTYQNFKLKLLFRILPIPFHHHGSMTFEKYYYYVPPKFVGFRSKHLRSKDKRGFIGRVTNCQKDKNHNSWNFYNRSKVIPVTWQSIVCSASKKFFHSRQMGQWELISNFPIFQHQYQLLEVHRRSNNIKKKNRWRLKI